MTSGMTGGGPGGGGSVPIGTKTGTVRSAGQAVPMLKLIASHTARVLDPYLRPYERLEVVGQGTKINTVNTSVYGDCPNPDNADRALILPYGTAASTDDYGDAIIGGPQPQDDTQALSISPGTTVILGRPSKKDSALPWQTDTEAGNGITKTEYGKYNKKNGKKAPGKKDKHVTLPQLSVNICDAGGLQFGTPTLDPITGQTTNAGGCLGLKLDPTPPAPDATVPSSGLTLGHTGLGLGLAASKPALAIDGASRGAANAGPGLRVLVDDITIGKTADGKLTSKYTPPGSLDAGKGVVFCDEPSGSGGSSGSSAGANAARTINVQVATASGLCVTAQDGKSLTVDLASASVTPGSGGGGLLGLAPRVPAYVPSAYHSQYQGGRSAFGMGAPTTTNPHHGQAAAWWESGWRAAATAPDTFFGAAPGSGSGSGCSFEDCTGLVRGSGLRIDAGDGGDMAVYLADTNPALQFAGSDGEGLAVLLKPDPLSALSIDSTGLSVVPDNITVFINTANQLEVIFPPSTPQGTADNPLGCGGPPAASSGSGSTTPPTNPAGPQPPPTGTDPQAPGYTCCLSPCQDMGSVSGATITVARDHGNAAAPVNSVCPISWCTGTDGSQEGKVWAEYTFTIDGGLVYPGGLIYLGVRADSAGGPFEAENIYVAYCDGGTYATPENHLPNGWGMHVAGSGYSVSGWPANLPQPSGAIAFYKQFDCNGNNEFGVFVGGGSVWTCVFWGTPLGFGGQNPFKLFWYAENCRVGTAITANSPHVYGCIPFGYTIHNYQMSGNDYTPPTGGGTGGGGGGGGIGLAWPTTIPSYVPSTHHATYRRGWAARHAGKPGAANPYAETTAGVWWNQGFSDQPNGRRLGVAPTGSVDCSNCAGEPWYACGPLVSGSDISAVNGTFSGTITASDIQTGTLEVSGSATVGGLPVMTDPMTAAGDLIVGGTAGAAGRIAVGTEGQVLTVVSGVPAWSSSSALTNPMTTAGDLIVGGAAGVPTRLGIGSNGQVLTVSGGALAWSTPTADTAEVLSVNGATGALTIVGTGGITVSTASGQITIDGSGVTGGGDAAEVNSLNGLTGALSITAGTNVTVTPSGTSIQIDVTIPAESPEVTSLNGLTGALSIVSGDGISLVATGTSITITNGWGVNPGTTKGDLVYVPADGFPASYQRLGIGAGQSLLYVSAGLPAWLAKGSQGQFLSVNGSGNLAWSNIPTSSGGIPTGGTIGQILTKKSATDYDAEWTTLAVGAGLTAALGGTNSDATTITNTWGANPLTTIGDMLYAAAAGTPATASRLAVGGDQAILFVNSNVPAWLAKGASGTVLTIDSTTGNLAWLPAGSGTFSGASAATISTLGTVLIDRNPASGFNPIAMTAYGLQQAPPAVTTSGLLSLGDQLAGFVGNSSGTLIAAALSGGPTYRSVLLGMTPIHYYRLDEPSGAAVDLGSGGINASYVSSNTTRSVTGGTGDGDNATQIADLASNGVTLTASDIPTGSASRTISLLARYVSGDTGNTYLLQYGSAGAGTLFQVQAGGTFALWNGSTSVSWTVSWSGGAWQHLVLTYDGTNAHLWANGSDLGARAITLNTSTGSTFALGAGGIAGWHTTANVDELAIWNRVLTNTEIANLYAAVSYGPSNASQDFIDFQTTSGAVKFAVDGAGNVKSAGTVDVAALTIKGNAPSSNQVLYNPSNGTDVAASKSTSASSTFSGDPSSNVVDGNDATFWAANTSNANEWVQVDLGSSMSIVSFRLYQTHVGNYTVTASNDGTNFTTIVSLVSSSPADQTMATGTTTAYRYWRFSNTQAVGAFWQVNTIQLFLAATPIWSGTPTLSALTLNDAGNLAVGSTTGTKIGTATTQKLAFFNSAPIVQPANTTDLRTAIINLGLLASGGATPLNLNGGALTVAAATFSGLVTVSDGQNIAFGTTTGTQIGTATTQKIALYGGTPRIQQAITGALSLVTDANAKTVLTSIIAALAGASGINLALDSTT